MPEDPSRNRYICKQTNEQLCTKTLWPLNKGTETKYKEIMWKPKWIYQCALINKQENRYKKEKYKT